MPKNGYIDKRKEEGEIKIERRARSIKWRGLKVYPRRIRKTISSAEASRVRKVSRREETERIDYLIRIIDKVIIA